MNRRILSFIISLLLLGCSVRLLSAYVVQLYFVSGDSMAPTYTSGQPVLIQKWGLPDCLNRGDVVIIHREDLHRDIVKRIVALPGDTVQIEVENVGVLFNSVDREDESDFTDGDAPVYRLQ